MLIIAGAGNHAQEVYDVIRRLQRKEVCFFDDMNRNQDSYIGCQVMHSIGEIKNMKRGFDFILGIGKPEHRRTLYEKMVEAGGELLGLTGQSVVSDRSIHEEADIMDLCFVGPETNISRGCLVNSGAQIHHHVSLGRFCEIGPGAVLLGHVKVGEATAIGANATILPGVKIGNGAVIGAGAVVTRDIPDGVTAFGNPARSNKKTG